MPDTQNKNICITLLIEEIDQRRDGTCFVLDTIPIAHKMTPPYKQRVAEQF